MGLVAIGRIVRPQGLRGEVRVQPLTDHPGRFLGLEACYRVNQEGKGVLCRIEEAREHGRMVVLRLEGCGAIDQAEVLVGQLLAVPEAECPPLPADHYYAWQLEGLQVVTEEGRTLGRLTEILRGPAHDIYVVREDGREILIPAVKAVVTKIAPEEGRIVVRGEGVMEE